MLEENPYLTVAKCGLVLVLLDLGRMEEARRLFEELARDDFRDIRRVGDYVNTLAGFSEPSFVLGDKNRGAVIYELLRPYRDEFVTLGSNVVGGAVARSLGALAYLLGDYTTADDHFEHALHIERQMGARIWEACTLYWWTRALAHSDRASDRARAIEVGSRALRLGRELNVPYVIVRTRTTLRGSSAALQVGPLGTRAAGDRSRRPT